MVTRYVISSRWSSHFLVKVHVLSTFATIKVTVVAKIMQSAYLFVIFHGKRKNLPFLHHDTFPKVIYCGFTNLANLGSRGVISSGSH